MVSGPERDVREVKKQQATVCEPEMLWQFEN